jgi:hypothetical protein
MTNLELRDKFKYKLFKISTDNNSIILFKLDNISRNKMQLIA